MAVKFNPFTGQLQIDEKGSGGGAQYLDGEVATYNDLSLDAGVAALNTAWLVRSASGTWLIGRKPAGIYIRTATAGVSRDADYTYAGIFPDVFSDANFTLYDDGDATRTAQFQLSGITTGQNRVLTVPDASGTIATTADFAAPPAIGNTTPNTGAFTALTAQGDGTNALVATFGAADGINSEIEIWGNGANRNHRIVGSTSVGIAFGLGAAQPTMVVNNGTPQGFRMFSAAALQWTSHGSNATAGTVDCLIFRDAADTVAQRRDTNPQTFRLYNTYTSATNFERLAIGWSGNVVSIKPEAGGGGGTVRELHISGLPTANPGPGILWNNAGTVEVGT